MPLDTVCWSMVQSFVKTFVGIPLGTALEKESYEAQSGKPFPGGSSCNGNTLFNSLQLS